MEDLLTKPETKISEPPMYNSILLNDDYTPMDFVVLVLLAIYNLSSQEAMDKMLEAHNNGKAIIGTNTLDIAETLKAKAEAKAKENEYPFRIELQKA